MLAYDYPLLGFFWTIFIVFLWFAWLMLLFRVIADLFRTHDMGGLSKALWALFVIVVPYLGVFIYLIVRGRSMGERETAERRGSVPCSCPTGERPERRCRRRDRQTGRLERSRGPHRRRVRPRESQTVAVNPAAGTARPRSTVPQIVAGPCRRDGQGLQPGRLDLNTAP